MKLPASAAEARGFDRSSSRELPDRRGQFQRVYDNADGTQTTEFSSAPTNYQRQDGSWAPIDTRLTAAGAAGEGWRNRADSVDVRLAGRADDATLAALTIDATHALAYRLAGAAAVPGRADGDTVTYPQVLPGVDLRLAASPGGVKETLVLRSASAPHTFTFPLRLTGLTARLAGAQVELIGSAGATRAVIPAGSMVDAAATTSTGVGYRLVDSGGQPALQVTVDSAWLRSADRRYPVEVDPTVSLPVDSGAASHSMYVQGSSTISTSSELLVGRVNGADAAAYVKFNGLVSGLQFHTIYGAALQVVNFDSASCKARPVTVHPVTAAWESASGYPGPAVGAAIASRSFAHGFIATGQSSSACPAAAELFDLGAAGRTLVQRWVNGQQANNGLSLRAAAGDTSAWKRFTSATTANPPRLFVTHSPYNASYSIPSPVPNPAVLQNQAGKVKVTVTNLSAEAWSPSTYYLAYRAYNAVTGAAVTQQRSADLTGTVARGGRVTLDATIKPLPPGKYFLDFTMVRSGGVVFTDHQVPPGRIVLQVFDIPPVPQEVYPPNGYQAPTLTPLLFASALDKDAPPGSTLQYKFEVCDQDASGNPTGCTNSGYQTRTAWTVVAGRLTWSKTYQWRAFVWNPWALMGGSMASPPAVGRMGDGTTMLFAVDADGRLWVCPPAGPWRSIAAQSLRGPVSLAVASDGVRIVGVTTAGAVKTAVYRNDRTISAWTDLGGTGMTGTPPDGGVRPWHGQPAVPGLGDRAGDRGVGQLGIGGGGPFGRHRSGGDVLHQFERPVVVGADPRHQQPGGLHPTDRTAVRGRAGGPAGRWRGAAGHRDPAHPTRRQVDRQSRRPGLIQPWPAGAGESAGQASAG